MTDTSDNTPAFETDEVEANHAIEQGLGVGARELAAQREAGEKAFDGEEVEEVEDDAAADLSDGRSQIKDI